METGPMGRNARRIASAAVAAAILTTWAGLRSTRADGPRLEITGSGAREDASHHDEYLVGVYYFAGWWRDQPNKWQRGGRDWRADWPQRVPTLGEYNEQATMDREIVAAADHGVDFFQILYYCRPALVNGRSPEPHADKLNAALEQFMASPHAGRMKFTLETVNHPPFDATTDQEWAEACHLWAQAMKHPSYLRVDGRPVFKIHGYELFLRSAGGDVETARARLDVLRQAVRDAGAGEVLLSAGILPEQLFPGELPNEFDFLTTYMWMPGGGRVASDSEDSPRNAPLRPYAELIDYAEAGWKIQNDKGPRFYVPYVPAGWDPRPWQDPRCSYAMPTRVEWIDALQRVKRALDTSPRLGAPKKDGSRAKMLLIYAWNEFGEGGIVAPTRGEGMMKLDAIREVFGRR
ncbi:MAG TPA: glycoside hydrolase family 99-like domain-containing protein [Phycisphaerae bacterium]|nr:glycoside hydrolase family 99-like domain-containing protein [Phycisphaerae bacterium]